MMRTQGPLNPQYQYQWLDRFHEIYSRHVFDISPSVGLL